MLKRKIKKTGDELSILGVGCMRLPEKNGKIDREKAQRLIYRAIDQGVNYLDTAFPYHMGDSEPFLGEILTGGYRDKVKIATKLPPLSVRNKEDLDRILNKQLQRLKTDRIDYYLLHGLEKTSWNWLQRFDILQFLDRARADGRIVNAGFSFHGEKDLFKEIVDIYGWQFCMIQYNFMDETNQAGTEGLKYAAAKDLGVMVMEPLRGGTLARDIPKEVQALWDAAGVKRSPAEWALRWVWNHPEVTCVLSGMSDVAQLDENLRVAGEAMASSLSVRELEVIGQVREKYRELMAVHCTGCRYCMPCPAGVNIPVCFDLYNRMKMFRESKMHALAFYAMQLGGLEKKGQRAYASQCIKCGKCLEKCPQQIAIPEELKRVSREYETFLLKLMTFGAKLFYSKAR